MSDSWEKGLTGRQRSSIKRIKASPFYADMIARGFTPCTPEWRKESTRLRMRGETYKNNKRDYIRKKYWEDVNKSREAQRVAKRRERERRQEEINEGQRERYRRESVIEAAKQRLRRWRREPHRAIRANANLYIQGLLTDEQYLERINDYVERAEQLSSGKGSGRQAE